MPKTTELRVMSYNIHHGIGMDRRVDLSRTIQTIRAARPDLVALQEVDRKTRRSNQVDQLQALADGTGMQLIFGKTIDFDGGEYGIAMLSRVPIEYQKVHPLPNTPPHEKRVLMELGVRVADRQIAFYNADLDDNKDDFERLGSIDVYEQSAREHPGTPIIFAGDLFVTSDHKVMRRLLETLHDSIDTARDPKSFTVPADHPVKRIDYVLYTPSSQLRCIEIQIIPDGNTAQHRPVLAVFEVR